MKTLRAVLTMISGTIGIGMFALPLTFYKVGIANGIIISFLAAICVLATNLFFADVITKEKKNWQIGSYTRKYFGSKIANISSSIYIAGLFVVLLATSVLAGNVIVEALGKGSYLLWAIFFSIL